LYNANFNLLYCCTEIYLVKKKNPTHPRLYLDLSINKNIVNFYYLENQFDKQGKRIILQESKTLNDIFDTIDSYLLKINQFEYRNLIKYIEIQKKVLEKHQKSGNYNACQVVKESILLMKKFKSDFENWFNNKI